VFEKSTKYKNVSVITFRSWKEQTTMGTFMQAIYYTADLPSIHSSGSSHCLKAREPLN
jgi:hypothetical protein